MTAKIFGAAAVTIAAIVLGNGAKKRLFGRAKELSELLDLVTFVESRMETTLQPLSVIYDEYLKTKKQHPFAKALADGEGAEAAADKLCYQTAETREVLCRFFSSAGGGFIDEEKRNVSLLAAFLEEKLKLSSEEAQKKGELHGSLWLLCGLMLVIILI